MMAKAKSHKPFQTTRKSSTSDDLEGSKRTARLRSCVFRSPPRTYLKEDRRILSAAKLGVKHSGVAKNAFFVISGHVTWECLELRLTLLYGDMN